MSPARLLPSACLFLPQQPGTLTLHLLLHLLRVACRSRLVGVVVAEAIANRPYDDPVPPNHHLLALHNYCVDRGRNLSGFRAADPLEIIR